MPKVSVVVPVYGVEKVIERCARSLFEQTLEDIEYIFVNDCTKDNSIAVLERIIEEYPNRKSQITILHHDVNKGLPQTRRTGIQLAKGEYIAHCDSDDWVDRDMYRAMYEKAKEDDADVVVCDYVLTDGVIERTKQGCKHTDKESYIKDICSMRSSWSLWNKLVKTDLLHKDIEFPKDNMGEDMALTLQIMLKVKRMDYIPKGLYYYYSNMESITHALSEDSIVSKFNQYKRNSEIVFHSFKNVGEDKVYHDYLDVIKLNVKNHLVKLVHRDYYYYMWLNTYSDINYNVFFNKRISIKDKIKYLGTLTHLYPRKKDRL